MGMTAFSVVIPLYNKEREIRATLDSVVAQTLHPAEVIVVDDGSTDRSAAIAAEYAERFPYIKLISQPNAGVSAARNKGVSAASSPYVSFLDADDIWNENYLETVAGYVSEYPGCGIYCTGFMIRRAAGEYPNDTSVPGGILGNYFRTALKHPIIQTSGVTAPKEVFSRLGGFPEGMKLGEDLYMWGKIADKYSVCYIPDKLYTFNLTAQNRSVGEFKPENTPHSFKDLYTEGNYWLNEYIAWAEIGRATVYSVNGYTEYAKESERFFKYTEQYKRGRRRLRMLNRLPKSWRGPANNLYRTLAWKLARKGKMD